MAGAILTSLIKGLSSLAQRASSSSSTELPISTEQELQKLEAVMKKIHDTIEEAEEKDISDKSEQLRLQELKGVAYDAEDTLGEYEYEVLHAKLEARREAMANHMDDKNDKVLFDLSYYHPKISISNKLACRVNDIRKRFEEITHEWDRIILPENVGKRRCIRKWKPMETTSCFDPAKTFGREDEKNRIIEWLLQEEEYSSGDTISVLGIVGMGGLGKTTLAQMSYNDARVRKHFNSRAWVYVSEGLDVSSLMKKIFKSFSMDIDNTDELNNINSMSLNELHWKIKVILDGKRFLLVLDDVWKSLELLSPLKALLVGAGAGKILVTSRSERAAKIMQTTPVIYLSHLSFDDSWLVFKKLAYEGSNHNFLEIGKKIVNKCRGLPLAIKVLAGILRWKNEEEAWVDLLESELWELDEEKDNIFPALKLSYDHLPKELKQCFMCFCLFPKGSDLSKSDIVQRWISHGFIQPEGEKIEEDVGDDYCNEFLHRSILQYDASSPSEEDMFIMHDLIHDLAQSVAKNEYLVTTTLKSHYPVSKTIRHLCIHTEDETDILNLEPLREAKHLRTLILSVPGEVQNMDVLTNLTCLRTLVLDRGEPVELPDSIYCLKHLRYLKYEPLSSIPASLYKFHFLQTLELGSLCKLSRDVGDLINLRHLRGYDNDHLSREVAGFTYLQTLSAITLGFRSDDIEGWNIKDLKGLPYLRGSLALTGLGTVTWPDVTPPAAYLKDKRGLKSLALLWEYDAQEELVGNVDEKLAAQVLDSLQPHRNLKTMWIHNYPGVVIPTWLGHELPALKRLYINGTRAFPLEKKSEGCDGFEWCSSLKQHAAAAAAAAAAASTSAEDDVDSRRWFPSLEELTIGGMQELEEWQGAEDGDFLPCLRKLTIYHCPKLRTLPSLARLDDLTIGSCLELRRLPSLPSLTKLSFDTEFSPELLSGCRCLPMLRTLLIYGYWGGEYLIFPDDGSLNSLEKLSITYCTELRSVEGLGGLASLRHLEIDNCPLLQISPDQRLPPNIKGVELKESPGAEEWYQNQVLGASECQATT